MGARRLGGESLSEWHGFSKSALLRSIEQINRVAAFTVDMEPIADIQAGRIDRVCLKVMSKTA